MNDPIPTPRSAPRPCFPWPILLGLVLAAVAATGLFLTWRRPAAPPAVTAAGGAAPAFRLASLEGRQLGPADFPGQVVVIEFWATWCVPCHLQAEVLAEVHAGQRGSAVQFLAVSVGEEEGTVRAFTDKKPFAYPVLLDTANEVADSFEVFTLPTIVVLDRQGRVVLKESGLVDARTIEKAVVGALAG